MGYTVEYDELDDFGQQLDELGAEFGSLADSIDAFLGAAGHRDVMLALDTFGSNWSIKREALAAKLSDLGELVSAAAETYSATDAGLARDVGTD